MVTRWCRLQCRWRPLLGRKCWIDHARMCVHKHRQRKGYMPIGDSEYSTLIILQLATATRGALWTHAVPPGIIGSGICKQCNFFFLNAAVPRMIDTRCIASTSSSILRSLMQLAFLNNCNVLSAHVNRGEIRAFLFPNFNTDGKPGNSSHPMPGEPHRALPPVKVPGEPTSTSP